MNRLLLEAYLDYSGDLARAGIIDDSLTENIDDDRPLDDRIADILRLAGRLPEGWDREVSRSGWHIATVAGDRWRVLPVPQVAAAEPRLTPVIREGYTRLRHLELAPAS
jgi:hypothetical protein